MSDKNTNAKLPKIKTEPDEQHENDDQSLEDPDIQIKAEEGVPANDLHENPHATGHVASTSEQSRVSNSDQAYLNYSEKGSQPALKRLANGISAHEFVPGTKIHLSALRELARRKKWINSPTYSYGLSSEHVHNLLQQGRSCGLDLQKPFLGEDAPTATGTSTNPFVLDDSDDDNVPVAAINHAVKNTAQSNKKKRKQVGHDTQPALIKEEPGVRTIAKISRPFNIRIQALFDLTKNDIDDLYVSSPVAVENEVH
jgi:hypothetical protein